jgi:hypothetical protein
MAGLPPATRERIVTAIRTDYAEATQFVYYGMAIALLIALAFALFHPGGRVTREKVENEPEVRRPPPSDG